jgi:hypothetical protein
MNQERFDAVLDQVATDFARGTLTKASFITAYTEARAALGDGIEAEAIEAITKYADGPDWLDEAEGAYGAMPRARRTASTN